MAHEHNTDMELDRPYARFDKQFDHIDVDFDGTLHDRSVPVDSDGLGPPVPEMLERIRMWLGNGMTVHCFTARVSKAPVRGETKAKRIQYVQKQRRILDGWFKKHLGRTIPLTCEKDAHTYELWDDRGVCVERNTGQILGRNPEW